MPTETEIVHLDCKHVLWTERTQYGHHRHMNAAAYVWGREDAGDRQLRLALQRTMQNTHSADWLFANFAANEADAYRRQETTHLQSVQAQYDRFLQAIKDGFIIDVK